jgi:hypothetical protein
MENAVLLGEFLDLLEIDRIGQNARRLISCLRESRVAQHVNHVLPAVLHSHTHPCLTVLTESPGRSPWNAPPFEFPDRWLALRGVAGPESGRATTDAT